MMSTPLIHIVDDDDSLVHIDLSRGQANSRRFIHRFCHVAGQAADAVVNLFNRRSDGFQARIGKAQYR